MKINVARIKQEMRRQGLTLSALGERMTPQYGRQAVSYMINHGTTLKTVEKLAAALGIPPKSLISK